ncbi:aldehyde dehydrogenase family protein [Cryptosporangium aurantiacum]|uniref:Aldehyde dehydrogenase n=1 Tax=Cryptosporangium aurantiacum TaxID=134849 RepID=A0A1M7RB65_9ACTN|nr:aldehyde dehydrogenase family protein [Cryptosporangium aurantiacum]SHN43372.1 Acyl-CoA reductase [Cryptosporangium aurantiacum]
MTAQTVLIGRNPATGEVLGEYPIAGENEVGAAVDRARTAATWWAGRPPAERRALLLAWKRELARGADELAALIRSETGKPLTDAGLEVMLAVEHLDWAARNAHRVLRGRTVRSGLLAANQRGVLSYRPLGVVGVIGPWNYPVYTPLGSVSYALAAGNAVVFKPSEYTPGVGRWLADKFLAAVGEPVLQVVTGDGTTGAALARSGVDKIAFTGSTATAKRVMAACAETLTPIVVEAGGKDAMIVAADADVDAAAAAAVFGGMGNSGQTCAGVERVYVERSVYAAFVDAVQARAMELRPGASEDSDYGPLTMPKQADVIAGHVADALARGGKPIVGGADAVRPPFVDPVVLTEVPEDSSAVTEETFGPVLIVNPVDDLDDAVRRANSTTLGLAGSVFTRDTKRGAAIAARLRVGAASVNSVLGFAAIPALPFGGVGDSGFGRIHGADGLREFSRANSLTVQRFRAPVDLMRFDRSPKAVATAWRMFRLRHARG